MFDVKVCGRWYDLNRVPNHLMDTPQDGMRVSSDKTKCGLCTGTGKVTVKKFLRSSSVGCADCLGTGVTQDG